MGDPITPTETSPVVEAAAAELPLTLPEDPAEARDLLAAELSVVSPGFGLAAWQPTVTTITVSHSERPRAPPIC